MAGQAQEVIEQFWKIQDSGDYTAPVSYTHLDVYKRQVMISEAPLPFWM